MESLPISVAEFVQSEAFSRQAVLLEHEAEPSSSSQSQEERHVEGSQHEKCLENALRVAVLIVRSLDDLCRISGTSHDETHTHNLSAIDLGDFFINLDKDSSVTSSILGQNQERTQQGPLGNCNDFYDYFNQLISEEEEKERNTVKDRNGKALGLGYFSISSSSDNVSFPAKAPPGGDGAVVNGNDNRQGAEMSDGRSINMEQQPSRIDETSRSAQETKATGINSQSAFQYVYGVDIIFPTRINDLQHQELQHSMATPMQILGKILYSLFCRGDPPPFDFSMGNNSQEMEGTDDADDDEYIDGRSSRTVRRPQKSESVLSQLVDKKVFPISISRLLSDLIDTGPEGQADCPFYHFDDVTQELTQMMAQPSICLYDSHSSNGMPNSPVFGQVYYGRDKEVAKIIEVAAKMRQSSLEAKVGVEAVFVSGIAGSGKSQLVQTANDHLFKLGWTSAKAKFERGMEHASRGIISSMFDEIISHLVKMKEEGNPSEVASSKRASDAILENIGRDGLSALIDFLPSLPSLYDKIDNDENKHIEDWQLSYCISTIIESVIESDQRIILVCDDLQWADRTTLALITELLTKLGEDLRRASRCCLFIGLYREDEVDDNHPFSIQYSYLQMSSNINTTEVKLSGLSKEDVNNMIMNELKLSPRLVRDLADAVYKKTSGHAYFIVELLNALQRDTIIAYSPKMYRIAWDQSRVDLIQLGDSVAELIASNISSLPVESQRILRILSSFGIQTDVPLLQILERFEEGIVSSLNEFVDMGILDQAGPIVIFTHDLIQQSVYESMSLSERQALHLDIGQYLGELSLEALSKKPESEPAMDPVTLSMGQLELNDQVFFAGSRMTSSLISIACDQIDSAGPDAISDADLRLQYSEWNLCAGQKTSHQSDFRAALYYFSKGIAFLGKECWLNDLRLCLALHEGALSASFALGESDHVVRYAENVIQHVPFEDTLGAQQLLLKSLAQTGKHDECIKRGVNILRQLDFDIPLSPTKETVMKSMASAGSIASSYSVDQIIDLCGMALSDSALGVVKIMDAFYVSCYASASPFLPLISCEILKYALKNGICQETAVAFASYGMFKIFFQGDYEEGKKWADVVRAITEEFQSSNSSKGQNFEIRAHILLYITIDIWFLSPREVAQRLTSYSNVASKIGQVDIAMISLQMGWRYLLYGGESLHLVAMGFEDRAELIAKNSDYATKYVALDNALLTELTGQSSELSKIDGMVCNIEVLQGEAELVNNNRLLHHIHVNNVMIAYWRGDFEAAEKSSHLAWKYPTAKMPTIVLIYHTFFAGLVAFHLFRKKSGDENQDERLKEGREVMVEMGKWAQNVMEVFGNKWLLMSAEHSACTKDHDETKKLYQASIELAQDYGNIHELGLAYELFGNYLVDCECTMDATPCFKKAYMCYIQWGAKSLAKRLLHKHNFDIDTESNIEWHARNSKRTR
mmetsp:Transcript_3889/g.8568  ORF Transcript_3889/g.8568 Transcript_3889/m.8568 type:complete len:1443 (+) Transcript_3889:166-4494(+)